MMDFCGRKGVKACVVLSTAGSRREANRIARTLVEKKLAACVNVVPGISSHFFWEGRVNRATEALMVIKTLAGQVEGVAREIKRMHSYHVPEILFLRVDGGDRAYLKWVSESTLQTQGNKRKKLLT